MQALLDYMGRLEVTQGEGLGESFPLFPWEKRFIKGTFATRGWAVLSRWRTATAQGIIYQSAESLAPGSPQGPGNTPDLPVPLCLPKSSPVRLLSSAWL